MEKIPQQREFKGLRIVLFGPESTGKTTLSRQLATYYNTSFIPEFAREYLQKKYDQSGEICSFDDLIPIAIGQRKLENSAIDISRDFLFCDTDPLETLTYSHIYFKKAPPALEDQVIHSHYDLYLLMDVDLPWVHDDLRDRPHNRDAIFETFRNHLIRYDQEFVVISGIGEERLQHAITAIENHKNQ